MFRIIITKSKNFSEFFKVNLKNIYNTLSLCIKTFDLIFPVLSDESPEGNIPSCITQSNFTNNSNYHVVSQALYSYCWRGLDESRYL